MFAGSWSECGGVEAGGEQVAITGDSELAVGVGELVEDSNRAMSVLCRKDLSAFSGDCDGSVRCSWESGLASSEDMGEGDAA